MNKSLQKQATVDSAIVKEMAEFSPEGATPEVINKILSNVPFWEHSDSDLSGLFTDEYWPKHPQQRRRLRKVQKQAEKLLSALEELEPIDASLLHSYDAGDYEDDYNYKVNSKGFCDKCFPLTFTEDSLTEYTDTARELATACKNITTTTREKVTIESFVLSAAALYEETAQKKFTFSKTYGDYENANAEKMRFIELANSARGIAIGISESRTACIKAAKSLRKSEDSKT